MKKHKHLLWFSVLMLSLMLLTVIFFAVTDIVKRPIFGFFLLEGSVLLCWILGAAVLLYRKDKVSKIISILLPAVAFFPVLAALSAVVLLILTCTHPYTGSFSMKTSLFEDKKVMIIVPHQDDDINLVGGLIEQYTQGSNEVSVVFSTNGDYWGAGELRAEETLSVLTSLGVKEDEIYYLGFGDCWQPQFYEEQEIGHIYDSVDPDAVWTSYYGATATYGTRTIDCYLELPYTRNNFLYSMESILLEKMPDTIFAVDVDDHADHKATSFFFEEALCNILKRCPDYHPTVYKGFCYGTAWKACADFHDGMNLLSTRKPEANIWDNCAFGYLWEDRVRFPVDESNLNPILINNSVYRALDRYASQRAHFRAGSILNGDKVFWERRTDSLLYDAEIFVGEEKTTVLNDFKLKDFPAQSDFICVNTGFVALEDQTVLVKTGETVTANCIYLYDNPSEGDNILAGYILFSDGSRVEFGELEKNGAATMISFPDKKVDWFEIVPTGTEGDWCGLGEVELYNNRPDTPDANNTYLMAVDENDHFVYNYILADTDSAVFRIASFPHAQPLGEQDVALTWESDEEGTFCRWEQDRLVVTCGEGSSCKITVSADAVSTTFTVSNPGDLACSYLAVLRGTEKTFLKVREFGYDVDTAFQR